MMTHILEEMNSSIHVIWSVAMVGTHSNIYFNSFRQSDDIWRLESLSKLFQVIACNLFFIQPLPETMQVYSHLDKQKPVNQNKRLTFKAMRVKNAVWLVFISEHATR